MDKFTEIYNAAYIILTNTDISMMEDYLFKEVKNGNISQSDAVWMSEDIIENEFGINVEE